MRTLGNILKKFFAPKTTNYWICVPSSLKSKKKKEKFIMNTLNFLQETITIEQK
jgi:hypothetical protein